MLIINDFVSIAECGQQMAAVMATCLLLGAAFLSTSDLCVNITDQFSLKSVETKFKS